MKWTTRDYQYMARALRQAGRGLYTCQPNPRVGCVIVKDDQVVGEGGHIQAGREHAEIIALNQAGSLARDASCYITLEPCSHTGRTPPCADALLAAGVSKVFSAMVDPNPKVNGLGLAGLEKSGIKTSHGLLEGLARTLNRGFIKRMERGMPLVRCKLAMSLDGKIALNSGQSKWITGQSSRHDVQKLRASSCAIMTGIGTILADDPMLTVREVDTLGRQPLRVIIDRKLRIGPTAKVLQNPDDVIIFTTSNDDRLGEVGIKPVVIGNEDKFLEACLAYLADKREINEVLVEAGPGLSGALIESGLVDELIIYQAPVILGDKAKSLFEMDELKEMSDKLLLKMTDIRHIGDDLKITYQLPAL